MLFDILSWQEVRQTLQPSSTILLGNGASMAVNQRFGYHSLLEYANRNNLLEQDVHSLFDFFGTSDFELILRIVWQANNVNISLEIPDERTRNAYIAVRESLIASVRAIHPESDDVSESFPAIYQFLKQFNTVLSLNYDLIVYWVMMYGFSINDQHSFKDCFINSEFQENWFDYRQPINGDTSSTLVFYPHGSLILARNKIEEELKITRHFEAGLLNSILNTWQRGEVVPLFVSEGIVKQKVNSINSSYYLRTVFREVLPSITNDLVIYGWGAGEQDLHILNSICSSRVERILVSVYGNDQAYCNHIHHLISSRLGDRVHVVFFDSQSEGCWNN